jgi:hypothetical protein
MVDSIGRALYTPPSAPGRADVNRQLLFCAAAAFVVAGAFYVGYTQLPKTHGAESEAYVERGQRYAHKRHETNGQSVRMVPVTYSIHPLQIEKPRV